MKTKLLGDEAENAHAVSVFLKLSSSQCGRPWLLHFCDPFKPKTTLCLNLFKDLSLRNCFCKFLGSDLSGRRGLGSPVSMEACCQDLGSACELPWFPFGPSHLCQTWSGLSVSEKQTWLHSNSTISGRVSDRKKPCRRAFQGIFKKSPLVGNFLWRKKSLPGLKRQRVSCLVA